MKRSKFTAWVQCEDCSTYVPTKDTDGHLKDCPPVLSDTSHNFIYNGILYGAVDIKCNEEIKGITSHDKNNLAFLSQSSIQLCELAIGSWTIITPLHGKTAPIARIVWPTNEKSVSSVLFTKTGLELTNLKTNTNVSLVKFTGTYKQADSISVVLLNAPKSLDLNKELKNRLNKLHLDRILTVGNKLSIFYYGKVLLIEIKSIEGDITEGSCNRNLESEFGNLNIGDGTEFYKITDNTSWKLYSSELDHSTKTKPRSNPTNNFIGGLNTQLTELTQLIKTAIYPQPENHLTFQPCKSVLIYGNTGTGKTTLTNHLARSLKCHSVQITAGNLYANADTALTDLLESAVKNSPSLVTIDDLDLLCPSRGATSRPTDTERKLTAGILTFLDECRQLFVFVVATCSRPVGVDAVFRRSGRFDREVELTIPGPRDRLEILQGHLASVKCAVSGEELKEVAEGAHGFVGGDLVALVSRAVQSANCRSDGGGVSREDFSYAMTRVGPSAMKEVQIECPNVKWSDIGGQTALKLILRQAVEWPLKHADCFIRMGISPPRGVLMYGPPGCSKTMTAKALATESGLNFLSIKGPELFSKWVGESERAVREVFRKARQVAPSIVFFDEIDALGGERTSGASSTTSVQERVLAQLLTELDGVTPLGDVTVLAATNRPDRIDKALLRPGRLDRIVYVPLPDEETRREIFRRKISKMPVDGVDIEELVSRTVNYSGAEVTAVCHEAAMAALEDDITAVTVQLCHFERALSFITPRTPQSLLDIYQKYANSQ